MGDEKDSAHEALRDAPRPGTLYRHYKGGLYSIVACSIREDTLEPLVTYRSVERGTAWTRTLANFTEAVVVEGGPLRRRFELERVQC